MKTRNQMSSDNQVIVLRGIDPVEVLQRFLNGDFLKNVHEKVGVQKTKPVQFSNFNECDASYTYKDPSGKTLRIRTMGNINMEVEQYCPWCRKLLTENDILGIPIKMKKENGQIYFYTVGRCSGIRCVLAFYRMLIKFPSTKPAMYRESESLIRLMYKMMGYTDELEPAVDFWNLECFGGSVSYDEMEKGNFKIVGTMNIKPVRILNICTQK